MENKSNGLKIALTYIAIFLLVILIAIPPVFRVVFSDTNKTTNDNSTQKKGSTTVLHCTKEENVGTLIYNVQTFSTYSDESLEKVIIRYTRTGELDATNQGNQYEVEMANLRSNSNITETTTTVGSKFEITKSILAANGSDPVIGLYAKKITAEQSFLTSNNYICQITKY